jgi:hypothetical protein
VATKQNIGGRNGICLRKARRARFDIGREGDPERPIHQPPTATRVFPLQTHASKYLRDAASSGNRTCETASQAEERRCAVPAGGAVADVDQRAKRRKLDTTGNGVSGGGYTTAGKRGAAGTGSSDEGVLIQVRQWRRSRHARCAYTGISLDIAGPDEAAD